MAQFSEIRSIGVTAFVVFALMIATHSAVFSVEPIRHLETDTNNVEPQLRGDESEGGRLSPIAEKMSPIDRAMEIEIQRHFNVIRSELLDYRATLVDWWLVAVAIFLTLLGIVAAIAGIISFKKFQEIRDEAQGYVEKIRKDAHESRVHVDRIKELGEEYQSNPEFSGQMAYAEKIGSVETDGNGIAEETVKASSPDTTNRRKKDVSGVAQEAGDEELSFRDLYNQGNEKAELEQYEEAIAEYDKAIRLKPDLVEAFHNRGVAKRKLGRYHNAIGDFDKAIHLKPDLWQSYFSRGNVMMSLGHHHDAIADFDKAISLNPNHAEVFRNRGYVKSVLDQVHDAIVDYDEALRLDSDVPQSYAGRAAAKNRVNQYESAIADCDQAIALKPDFDLAYKIRGDAKSNLGRYTEAVADYSDAISIDSNYARAYGMRGVANVALGRLLEARRDFEDAYRLSRKLNDTFGMKFARIHLEELEAQSPKSNTR